MTSAGSSSRASMAWLQLLALSEEIDAKTEDPSEIDFEAALFRLHAHTRLARLARAAPGS